MKKYFLVSAALCVLALCTGLLLAGQRNPESLVKQQLEADLPQLTQAAQALLAGEPAQIPQGWTDAEVFGDVVCFDYRGWGFGSSTRYWGVTYVPGDYPVGFQGTALDGAVQSGDGWIWSEKQGDNRCYVQRLAPCWYYYNMEF